MCMKNKSVSDEDDDGEFVRGMQRKGVVGK
jgi:hypothetical protein